MCMVSCRYYINYLCRYNRMFLSLICLLLYVLVMIYHNNIFLLVLFSRYMVAFVDHVESRYAYLYFRFVLS